MAQLPPAVDEAQPLGPQTCTCPSQAQEGQGSELQMYLISPSVHPASRLYLGLHGCQACLAGTERAWEQMYEKKGGGKGTDMCYPEGPLLSFNYITSGLGGGGAGFLSNEPISFLIPCELVLGPPP